MSSAASALIAREVVSTRVHPACDSRRSRGARVNVSKQVHSANKLTRFAPEKGRFGDVRVTPTNAVRNVACMLHALQSRDTGVLHLVGRWSTRSLMSSAHV